MYAPATQIKVMECLEKCDDRNREASIRFAQMWRRILVECLDTSKRRSQWYHLTAWIEAIDRKINEAICKDTLHT